VTQCKKLLTRGGLPAITSLASARRDAGGARHTLRFLMTTDAKDADVFKAQTARTTAAVEAIDAADYWRRENDTA